MNNDNVLYIATFSFFFISIMYVERGKFEFRSLVFGGGMGRNVATIELFPLTMSTHKTQNLLLFNFKKEKFLLHALKIWILFYQPNPVFAVRL